MINLIANTGIHFKKTEVEFNPNDAYIIYLAKWQTTKVYFCGKSGLFE